MALGAASMAVARPNSRSSPTTPLLHTALALLLLASPLLLASASAASPPAQDSFPVTQCTLSMTSDATSTNYLTSINCTGLFPLDLVAHASEIVAHNVTYFFNDEPFALDSSAEASHLAVSASSPALLTLSFGPDTPCTADCTLEITATASSLILPTLAQADLPRAYTGLHFTNIPILNIRSSTLSILKNETSAFLNGTDSESEPFLFLFNQIYNGDLTAATVMVTATSPGMHLTVSNSSFFFAGSPVTESDYNSYYGGPRSFPDVQLSALALMKQGAGDYASVDLDSSTFSGHVSRQGGALFVPSCERHSSGRYQPAGSSLVRISGCIFDSNQAYFQGGAVFLGPQCNASLSYLSFTRNALVDNDLYYHRVMRDYEYRGGAVFVHNPDALTISNCAFRNNTADVQPWNGLQSMGGAIHLSMNHTFTPASETESISNPIIQIGPAVVFSGNDAYTGGALSYADITSNLWWEGELVINLTGAVFYDNTAITSGGAVYLQGPSEYANGGSYHARVSVAGCTFEGNEAKQGDGGALYAEQLDSLVAYATPFSENWAPQGSGGAAAATLVSELSFGKTAFEANHAQSAGAISIDRSWMFVYRSDFLNNTATAGNAGAIKASPSSFFIEKTKFAGNVAAAGGGAISVEQRGVGSSGRLYQDLYPASYTPMERRFSRSAQAFADFQELSDSTWQLIPANINTSEIYFPKPESLTNLVGYISGSRFEENAAPEGGAVCSTGAGLVIAGSRFKGNAAGSGGAVSAADCSGAVNTHSVSFSSNTARGLGGAVAASGCNVTFNGTSFSRNLAAGGGAVYTAPRAVDVYAAGAPRLVAEFNLCNVTSNRGSARSGGGLLALGSEVTLRGGAWGPGNRAAMSGAAVAVTGGGALNLEGSPVIAGNTAHHRPEKNIYL